MIWRVEEGHDGVRDEGGFNQDGDGEEWVAQYPPRKTEQSSRHNNSMTHTG